MSVVEEMLANAPAPSARDRRRTARRNAIRTLRPGRTPAGIAVAAALSLTTWAVVVDSVAGVLGLEPMPWIHRLLTMTLGDPVTGVAAGGMVVAGAVLVALAVLPGRSWLMPLESVDPLVVTGLTRRGLRRTLAEAARRVDGVEIAYVRVLQRQIEVTVFTDAQRTGEVLREVGAAVGDRLTAIGLQCRREVVVRLRRRRT